MGRRLGCGAFATVYEAQLAGSRAKWVVKRLDRVAPEHSQQVSNEVEVLTAAGSHPNLVPFRGWWRDAGGVLCLLLGQCEGGTLAALLKGRAGGSEQGLFEEDMVMCWFVQLLLALHHLHGRRVLHRDLKPDNVLLSGNLRVARLADFGVSKQLEAGVGLAVTCLGTPHYMSPEVITHRPYTFASDMWALGAVLYEMAARRPAFDARGLPQLVVKILRNAYMPLPLSCSRPLQQLVGMLLRADPDDRPTTADLLATSLVRKHLQLLLGLAQGVHRAPAAASAGPAAAAAEVEQANAARGSRSGTPEVGKRGSSSSSSQAAAAAGGTADSRSAATSMQQLEQQQQQQLQQQEEDDAAAEEVQLGATKRPSLHAWDASAAYEVQQKKRAEARYQARIMEQRMAREQARQRRKELDPAAAARAAAQQQELDLLQEAQRRGRQAAAAAAADSSSGSSEPLSLSAEAAAAAAAAVQDEQLQLLLEQLRGNAAARAPGSSNASSPLPWVAAGDVADDVVGDGGGSAMGSDDEEVEEELGLDDGLDSSADAVGDDEDYAQALALVAASEGSAQAAADAAAGSTAVRQAAGRAAAAAGRAWRLVMASLEDEAFAALLPPCKASAFAPEPPAAIVAAAAQASPSVSTQQQLDGAVGPDVVSAVVDDAVAPISLEDDDGLPQLLQSPDSPTSSPRHRNKQQHGSSAAINLQQQQQQQHMQEFNSLEQQLESALQQSDSAAAQQLISSIYRMSLSLKPASSSSTQAASDADLDGSSSSSSSQRPVLTSFKRGAKQRPKSAADEERDRRATAAAGSTPRLAARLEWMMR
ncbi:hypothetical protein OEZ86_007415 [Tetradesmus obliquus]|nr:hypothetical protein OEZ86_007415 [Tetradesmus obliquus]